MPQIRFCGLMYDSDVVGEQIISDDSPISLTFEITGGGPILNSDLIELCVPRKYKKGTYGEPRWKWKLRPQVSRRIDACPGDYKRITLIVNLDDLSGWFFNTDGINGSRAGRYPFYARIKRITGWGVNGRENNAIFSNILTLWRSYGCNKDTGVSYVKIC